MVCTCAQSHACCREWKATARELHLYQVLVEASISNRSEAVFCKSGTLPQPDQTQGQVFWEPFFGRVIQK